MFPHTQSKNLDDRCRTCLNCTAIMYDIFSYRFDVYVSDILYCCTNIKVEQHDTLPKKLCSSCYNCLVSFYDFRRQAERIDQDLKSNFQGSAGKQDDSAIRVEIKPETDDDCKNDFDHDYSEMEEQREPQSEAVKNNCHNYDFRISREQFHSHLEHNHKIDHNSKQLKNTKYVCDVCKKSYRNLDKFRTHFTKHKKKKLYQCDYCLKTFIQESKFTKHLGKHASKESEALFETDIDQIGNGQRFELSNSSENISSYNLFLDHKQGNIQHSSETDKVIFSSQSGKIENKVKNGSKETQNERYSVECDICFAKFKSINSLSAHKRVHIKKGRVLSCSSCGKIFKKMNHLKRHEFTHDVNRPFKCDLCPKSFITDALLKEHLNVHCGMKLHHCTMCSKSFARLSTLQSHLKTHTREKVYMCSICGKTFECNSNLNQHMKRHIGLKTFSCTLCPQSFVSKGELKSHTITHTGERAYACDQCGATFTKRTSLRKHTLAHLGIRPHQCKTCSMRFASNDHLKRHIRIHTGEKPYRCDMCDRAFTQSNDLVKHRRAHLGDKLYRCNECSESFRLKTELRRHISEHFISSRLQALNVNKTDADPENLVNGELTDNNAQKATVDTGLKMKVDIMENLSNAVENTNNRVEQTSNVLKNSNNVREDITEDRIQCLTINHNGTVDRK